MASFDHDGGPVALRTPLYPIIALFGVAIVVGAFLPWAGFKSPSEGEVIGEAPDGFVLSLTGLDAGGWGLAAIIAGAAIAFLGVLGYFWNPFSDPEAMFIAAFSAVVAVSALFKFADTASLFPVARDFDGANATVRQGLWVILIAAAAALVSAIWILLSRPRAQTRLVS